MTRIALVDDGAFFRCNKCCPVNLEHAEGIDGNDAVMGGESVRLSRSKKKAFLDALNNCINEVGR